MFKRLARFFLKLCLWFLGISIGTTLLFRFVPVPVTPLMIIRVVEQAIDRDREVTLRYHWRSLEKINKSLPLAVITSEDQKFGAHYGFDLEAIEKAQQYNERHKGKKMKGASTISQQTAKNVFLWPQRSYFRKALEVYFTFLIETLWSKERIMEVYLNVIEMGDGIYGAEAAAKIYFKKEASKLTRPESALIAACLPNPRRWHPDKPTSYILKKKSWILARMDRVDRPGFIK